MLKRAVVLSLLAAAPAAAQQAPKPDAAVDPDRDTIVVTATRGPTDIAAIASSISVLDKAAIDRSQDLTIADLLLRTPGVSLSRNGGYGTATQFRIRGAETDQTVVVIDGVKLNDPSATGGGYNFANLLVGDAARIEVLRGPQSILWGSQAIGGVVNVVTALPGEALTGTLDVETGSRKTLSARAGVGGRTGPLAWRIGAQSFTTAGISAIAPAYGGREKDPFHNRSLTGRATLDLATGVSAELRGYYSRSRVSTDATTADSQDFSLNREFVGYAGLNVDLFDGRFRNRLGYGYTDTDRDSFNPTRARPLSFDAAGRNQRLEYQGSLRLVDGWTAVFGAEHERARFRSVSPSASLATPIPAPARGAARLTGFYGQLSGEVLAGLTLNGGVRHDHHSRYGGKTLVAGGAAWALPTGLILRASYGEGFKAPSLYQLFSEFGNRALDPEQAHGWEAGAEQHLLGGALSVGATWFERRTTSQIVFASCPATGTNPLCFQPGSTTRRSGYYLNVSRAYAQGIEASAQARLGSRLLVDGNYSWIESEDRSPGAATFGKWLARRPRRSANAALTYTLPAGPSAGVALRWSGHSFDNAANTTRLASYTLVDLRAELPLSDEVRLFGRVENLFDRQYQTILRYGTLGRGFYAGVRGRF